MDGVMTEDEARKTLAASYSELDHFPLTVEPSSEEDILNERLERYGYDWKPMGGDGNCVARSVADQIMENEELHEDVRRAGVAMLIKYPEHYEPKYYPFKEGRPRTYDQFIKQMSCVCEDIEPFFTQAICDAYGVRIIELVSNHDYCIAEFTPRDASITKTIRLVSSSGHTDSMYLDPDSMYPDFYVEMRGMGACVESAMKKSDADHDII